MAFLRFFHSVGRASPVHTCQRCRCSVNHRAAGVLARKRSPFHAAQHLPRSSTAGNERERPHPFQWDLAGQRPFHSSCHSRNEGRNIAANAAIGHLSDEGDGADQSRLGESFTDVPGATNTKGKKLAIIYTCKVCNTRSAKQFTEQSYRHGVVLVRCPGCQNLHLIADRLGWFEGTDDDGCGKDWDVEKALAKAGENVKAVSGEDVLELTLDDVVGKKT